MKLFFWTMLICCCCSYAQAQHVYQIRADSVRIYNTCDTAELIIENRTQDTLGFLYNKGKGRTEFRKLELKAIGNDAIAIVGQDTLQLSAMGKIAVDTLYRGQDTLYYRKTDGQTVAVKLEEITLQKVTTADNTTSNAIFVTGRAKIPATGSGMLLRYDNSFGGTVVAYSDRATNTVAPMTMMGEALWLNSTTDGIYMGSGVGIEIVAQDRIYISAVNGTVFSEGDVLVNNLDVVGSLKTRGLVLDLNIITGNYTAGTVDHTIINRATSGNPVLTLPPAATNKGRVYYLMDEAETANRMTITPAIKYKTNSFTTLDAAFFDNEPSCIIQSDGINWIIIKK